MISRLSLRELENMIKSERLMQFNWGQQRVKCKVGSLNTGNKIGERAENGGVKGSCSKVLPIS